MALLLAGVDEAGYGPLLGPLTVALAAVRVASWTPGDPAPDLWDRLAPCVARSGSGSPRDAILVDDSKRLKLPNPTDSHPGGRHPLFHLERGVLAFLAQGANLPADDLDLFESLGVDLAPASWAQGERCSVPVAWDRPRLAIASNALANALASAGADLQHLRCLAVGVDEFNRIVRETASKAEATIRALGRLARDLLAAADPNDHVRIVCDRLGGRTRYAPVLERELNLSVRSADESDARSRYTLDAPGLASLGVVFMPEGERAHLPVALASMTAKYVRELSMARFNRYWCARIPDLKPTAGYRLDAARWLRDAAPSLPDSERHALIRQA